MIHDDSTTPHFFCESINMNVEGLAPLLSNVNRATENPASSCTDSLKCLLFFVNASVTCQHVM